MTNLNLTATEIRKKYYSATFTKYKNPHSTCDKCHKSIMKSGDGRTYTYGYQTQYCSRCIVPVVKADHKTKKQKRAKKKRKTPTKRKSNSSFQKNVKKVRKMIKKHKW